MLLLEDETVKSTVDEIRQRFDADVERSSNLETGQSATVDAPLAMALVAEAAAVTTPHARHVQVEVLHKNVCFAAFGAVRD